MKQTLILLLFLMNSSLCAQDFLNLDFEYNVYKAQPRKWVVEGEGKYYASVDSLGDRHSGKKCLLIHLRNAEAYVFLSLPANLIRGKTISVTGFVKAHQFDSMQIMLGFKDPQGKPKLTPLQEPIRDQWNELQNQISISTDYNSDKLLVALIVVGTGDISFDDVMIKVNGTAIGNKAPHFEAPRREEINELNRSLIPIQERNSSYQLDDLKSFDKLIGDPKVIALGENSHGSASIFKLKLRLVQYFVKEKGYSMFALECPSIEADLVNEYVMTNVGTIENVLNSLVYPSWRTQEMIDIIEWIKNHNQTATTKVQFRGFDMQDRTAALSKLAVISNNKDGNEFALRLDSLTSELKKAKPDLVEAYKRVESLEKSIDKVDGNSPTTYSGEMILEAKRCALIVKQNIGLALRLKSRDEYMADNIQWLLASYCSSDGGIIVSADNSHITKSTGKMGQFLRSVNGVEYLSIGFTFNSGSYAAYGDKKYYEAHPSYVGTYEYLFSKANVDNFILDLRKPEIKAIVESSKGFRSIGSRPQETTQFSEIVLPDNYDLIVYLENSTHTIVK